MQNAGSYRVERRAGEGPAPDRAPRARPGFRGAPPPGRRPAAADVRAPRPVQAPPGAVYRLVRSSSMTPTQLRP